MSLRKKLLTLVVLPLFICTSAAVILSSIKIYNQGIKGLTDKSNAILNTNILEFVHNHADGNSIIEHNLIDELKGVTSRVDTASLNFKFRIASPNPFGDKHKAGPKEMEFINRFETENLPQLTYVDKVNKNLWVMRPVFMDKTKGCMECHDTNNSNSNTDHGALRGIFIVESNMQQLQNQVTYSIFQTSLFGLFAILIAAFLGIVIVNKITRGLKQIMIVSEKVSKGDLNDRVTIKTNDDLEKLGEHINSMIDSLNNVLKNVKTAATELNSATNEMTSTSAIISNGAQNQIAQFNELSDSVQQSTQYISVAAEFAIKSELNANEVEMGMNNTLRSISRIEESSQKIYHEVQIINSIAFQTKILALNAAIEAARAGEFGRGFAVVAAEVQKLSETSTNSSKIINEVTENTLTQVKDGVKIAKDAGEKIHEIIAMVKQIASRLNQISENARVQSEIVSKNTEITNLNAASSEELDASAQALKEQADALLNIVSYFNIKNQA